MHKRVFRPLTYSALLSASKEKTHREAIPKGTPKQSQVQKIYSRKTAAPSPKGGFLKSSKAAPSKSLQCPSWQPQPLDVNAAFQRLLETRHPPVSCRKALLLLQYGSIFFCNQNQTPKRCLRETSMDTKRIARALAAAPVGASLLIHSGPVFIGCSVCFWEVGRRQVMLQGKQMACSASIRGQLVLLSQSCDSRKQGQVKCQASNYIPLGAFSSNCMPTRKLECLPFSHTGGIYPQVPRPLRRWMDSSELGSELLSIFSRNAEYPVYFRWP